MTDSTNYSSFRQRLDAMLRTRDMRQVRAFLIQEGQWTLEQPADPEYAMWLMIGGTVTLKDLHSEARQWLIQHGHSEAAEAVFGRSQASSQDSRGAKKQGARPVKKTGAGPQRDSSKGQAARGTKQPRECGRQAP